MSDKNSQAERERMVLDIKVKLQVQCFSVWFWFLPHDGCCVSFSFFSGRINYLSV